MSMSSISRRRFLELSAFGTAGAAVAGMAGCSPATPAPAEPAESTVVYSGKHTWEVVPDPIAEDKIVETLTADIVVIGAGVGGCAAAEGASELGAKVIVLEQSSSPQGRGADNASLADDWHKEMGWVYDPMDVETRLTDYTFGKGNRELIHFWAHNVSGVWNHYLERFKSEGYLPTNSLVVHYGREEEDFFYREYVTPIEFYKPNAAEGELAGGETMVAHKFAEWATKDGAQFFFNTRAEQLVKDADGSVHTVIAKGEDGKYRKYIGTKGIILACGDIAGNAEMVDAWCPSLKPIFQWNAYTPEGGNVGDGMNMAMWVGAAPQKFDAAPAIHTLGIGNGGYFTAGACDWMAVNRDGRRFMNEFNTYMFLSNAVIAQPGSIAWKIYDGHYKENILKQFPENMDIFGPMIDENTDAKMEDYIKQGTVFRGNTIEELAPQIGADPAVLKATIERYNKMYEDGADLDFGAPVETMVPVLDPPYYAARIPATILVCIYGLNCDRHSRVCDAEDNPIPGLFAVGNMQGNFLAQDYPMLCPGLSHSRAVVFGRLVAQAMAKGELIEPLA